MEKYIEQVKSGWQLLNGRDKNSSSPIKLIFLAAVLQALACWMIALFFTYFFAEKIKIADSQFTGHISIGVALVSSLAIIAFNTWANRGKTMGSLSWFGDFAGKWQAEYYESTNISEHYNVIFFNALTLCKILCLTAIISSGQTFWLIYAFTLANSSLLAGAQQTGLIKDKKHIDIEVFTYCGIFVLVSCILHRHLIPVIIATAAAYFFHQFAIRLSLKKIEIVNDEINRTLSEVILCISLIIGILLIK
ncbi:MAG: hypothetical protein MK132_13065 [Lentisphaerales bacterium]|nr:hypothetical protein [Lentisphaerales bacterium]